MPGDDQSLLATIKAQILRESRMSPQGLDELMQSRKITHDSDRESLRNYLLNLVGRLSGCPVPKTPSPGSRHF